MDYLSLNTTSAWFPDLDSPFFLICQIVRTFHSGFLFAYSTSMLFHGFHYFYVSSVIRPGVTQYSHSLDSGFLPSQRRLNPPYYLSIALFTRKWALETRGGHA